MRALFVVFGVLMLLGSQPRPVGASEGQLSSAEAWMTLRAARVAQSEKSVEEVRNRLLQTYWRDDIDGGGISDTDAALHAKLQRALLRTTYLGHWLRMDLDGDGDVTRGELEIYHGKAARRPMHTDGILLEPTPEQFATRLRKLVSRSLRADRNGDQIIAYAEMLSVVNGVVDKRSARGYGRHRTVPLSLDADGDGIISRDEFISLADRVLEGVDADRDGTVSVAEAAALQNRVPGLQQMEREAERARRRAANRRQMAEACGLPPASPEAKILLLSASHGHALSSVGLGGDDVVVRVADAVIEPGTEPLYILLTSAHATVWRFMGAVDRIEAIVAGTKRRRPRTPLAGVVGIEGARVHLPDHPDCLKHFTNVKGNQAAATRFNVKALIGRAPDNVLRTNAVSTVSLPGGLFDQTATYRNAKPFPDTGAGAPMWQEARRAFPGGLVEIDPLRVVSRAKAKPYVVLPRQAGLASLLDEGALEIIGTAKVVRQKSGPEVAHTVGRDGIVTPRGRTAVVVERPNEFLIVKKIRFPAGLSGGHAVTFQLAPGVPEPEGSPGSSCVRHQATGEPMAGNRHCG